MSTKFTSTYGRLAKLAALATVGLALATGAAGPSHAAYVLSEISVAGATSTAAWDINNSGTIVGYSTSGAGAAETSTGFILSGGSFTMLGGPAGAISSNALGISDAGVVVGSFVASRVDDGTGTMVLGPAQGFIYSGGAYTTFNVTGANETLLRGISPDGRYLSGYYTTDLQAGVGFYYDTVTSALRIVSAPNSQFTIAQGMNNAGTLVGGDILSGPPTTRPGFLYDIATDTRTDVVLAGAGVVRTALRSIDDDGVLAGWFIDATGQHGFVGSATSYEQIDYAGAESTVVEGSNNARWLVGTWFAGDTSRGFVAVPVPVPGSLPLVLAGLLAAVAVQGRRRARQG